MISQLPLVLSLDDQFTFSKFIADGSVGSSQESFAGENQQASDMLQRFAVAETEDPVIYLFGAAESGKTHLVQATVRAALDGGRNAFYLPSEQLSELPAEALKDFVDIDLFALDGLGLLCGDEAWETALFHLLNARRRRDKQTLIAHRDPPRENAVNLPDLKSRLAGALPLALSALSDDGKQTLLARRAGELGLEMPEDVGLYLMRHLPRDIRGQLRWLSRLDEAALAANRRKLSVQFVKSVLMASGEVSGL